MDSFEIKVALSCYFRYKKQSHYIATEAINNADFNAILKNGELIEVEIKTSWGDFINDFKKHKHYLYENLKLRNEIIPNKFYYCAPLSLAEKINKYLDSSFVFIENKEVLYKQNEYYKKFGVLALSEDDNFKIEDKVFSLRKPKHLHKNIGDYRDIIARYASTNLANAYTRMLNNNPYKR